MITAAAYSPSLLPPTDRAAWSAFCAATPVFRNPLLGPDFAEAVGRRRGDTRVTVFRRDGRAIGFLAYHHRSGGFARPVGSPFSDYHALITEPGVRIDAQEAMSLAGLSAFRFAGLLDPHGCFDGVAQRREDAFLIKFGEGGADAYRETVRAVSPKLVKNWRRLESKLEREAGEIAVIAPDHDRAAFDTLMRWKSDQLRMSGLHDFLRPDWTLGLMQDLFMRREGCFQGMMLTVRAGGRLIAGHFGVRLDDAYLAWIASIDPDESASAWSPGQTLISQAIKVMPKAGLTSYDLGPGHGHYKRPFCATVLPVGGGIATAAGSAVGPLDQALAVAAAHSEKVTRLLRRMDHIAATELSMGGRLRGVAEAFAGQGRRLRPPADDSLHGG